MAYQVLARKWRPSNFSQMVGQEHVVKALTTALESERLHHAYLFTGTRGVGKTTVARLIAKSLNCETGVTAEPWGNVRVASRLPKAEALTYLKLMLPLEPRSKIRETCLIMFSTHHALALQDLSDRRSSHALESQLQCAVENARRAAGARQVSTGNDGSAKTACNRVVGCLQFNLKNMVPQQIIDHLRHVLAEESVGFDDESLALLARGAEGSMRDALSLTDQAIAHGSGKLAADEVRQMLGTVSRTKVFDLLDAIVANDPKLALAVVEDIASHSPDYAGTLDELASVLHQISWLRQYQAR